MTSRIVTTVEIETSSARGVTATFNKAEIDILCLHPIAMASDGTLLVGADATERLQVEPTAGAGPYLSRIGDRVPLHIGGSPWAAHDVLATILTQQLAEHPTDVLRLVSPPEWGPHRRALVRTALLAHGIGEVELVSATDAVLHEAQDKIPAAATRVLIINANDNRISATAVSRQADETPPRWQVAAVAGHDFGGTDIDDALMGFVTARVAPPSSVAAAQQLRENCRAARERLSAQPVTELEVPDSGEKLRLVRADLEALTGLALRTALSGLLLRVGVSTTAEATPTQSGPPVDLVLLTGGLATMPLLVETLSQLLELPVHVPADPLTVALRGAAAMPAPATEQPATIDETDQLVSPTRTRAWLHSLRELRVIVPSRRTLGVLVAALALMFLLPLGARGLPDDLAGVIREIGGSGPAKILVVNAPGAQAAVGQPDGPAEAITAGMDLATLPAGGKPALSRLGTLKGVVSTEPAARNPERTRPSVTDEPAEPASLRGTRTASDPTKAAISSRAASGAQLARTNPASPRATSGTAAAPATTTRPSPATTRRPTTTTTQHSTHIPTSNPATVASPPITADPPSQPTTSAPQNTSVVPTSAPPASQTPLPVADVPVDPVEEPPADDPAPNIGGDSEVDQP